MKGGTRVKVTAALLCVKEARSDAIVIEVRDACRVPNASITLKGFTVLDVVRCY